MYESIYKNNELENEVSSDMSYFWYSDVAKKDQPIYSNKSAVTKAKSQNSSSPAPVVAVLETTRLRKHSKYPLLTFLPDPMAQVRPNEPSRPALLQRTLKFISNLFIC